MESFQPSSELPAMALLKQEDDFQHLTPEEEAQRRRERRRRQCRMSQRRYRDKKGSAEYNLKLDVNNLRESVQRLRGVRELLETKIWSTRLARDGAVLKATEQYYTVFSHGMHDLDGGSDRARKHFDLQVSFANAFMDPDVLFGDSRSPATVLYQWRLYTKFHATASVWMVSAEVCGTEDSPIVVVKGMLSVRMNRSSIENMFPHILANEELVQVLLSREIEYPTYATYVFNERSQVERLDLDVDFLAGISTCLGSTYATSRVMHRALISDCSKLGQVAPPDVDARLSMPYILC